MIVADVNLIAYYLIQGDFAPLAEAVYRRDRRWITPRSHRFELLNVVSSNVRRGFVRIEQFDELWRRAFRLVATPTEVEPHGVLQLSMQSRIATYDCEYVMLARERRLKVVTKDREMIQRFGDVAVSMEEFASGK